MTTSGSTRPVAMVTGAARGIGRAIAKKLAESEAMGADRLAQATICVSWAEKP